jgi:adenine-specific DNA-methyltransferase
LGRFPNPKPTTLIGGFVEQTTQPGEWVMDFFVGSGTTGHAILALDEPRRFVLSEMGDYFDRITKPRLARLMFSRAWKDGAPGAAHPRRHIVKVQRLEQYEDVLSNLGRPWDKDALPEGVPVRYLFRPDETEVRLALKLERPFANTIIAGREGREAALDLLETRALLQGLWVRSRRTFDEGGKHYRALESECGCLIIFRDIADGEDDSEAVNRIAASYTNDDGSPRLLRLELNHWADLRRITLPATLLTAGDFDRGAQWS